MQCKLQIHESARRIASAKQQVVTMGHQLPFVGFLEVYGVILGSALLVHQISLLISHACGLLAGVHTSERYFT